MTVLALLWMIGGCARYEYQLKQPADWSRHIGPQVQRIDEPPLGFVMQTYENRLVLQIENHAAETVKLIGGDSWLISPDGQTRSLADQTIAPGSFIKLILPPVRPRAEPSGPTIGFGIGGSTGGRIGTGVGVGTTFGRNRVYIVDEEAYWDWDGGRDVKLKLSFALPDGKTLTRQLLIERQKM